ncbi:MAG: methylmalonyl-CoA mutase family protein [Phycisphaerae bacterium]|nr:methylmalonyl-CoA mutase family protein [Phycisphaerae bacterium]
MLSRTLDYPPEFNSPKRTDWMGLVEQDLKGAPFEKRLISHTYEGLYIQPLYTEDDAPTAEDPAGWSGLRPLTRGAAPLGTSQRGWEIRVERNEPDPAALNAALLDDLEGGADGVLLRFDACARAGRDALDAGAPQLAGRDGAMIYALPDLQAALGGVQLSAIHVALECGAAFTQGAALLTAAWRAAGVPASEARGAFNADPLAVLARDGALPVSLAEAMRLMSDLAAWSAKHLPRVTAVRVGTAPYHHAGATATQDLAFSIATALEYLRTMTRAGMSVEQAARQMEFSYAVGTSVFLAVGKLRAARRLWARALEVCGVCASDAPMRMHVRTSKRVLSTRDPWVNMLRDTAGVIAAGLGGADVIGVTPFDLALGPASALARRAARNAHHILMAECGVHRVCDPAGGSWYVEKLTDDLCRGAWAILQAIESRGGMAEALLEGWIAAQVESAFASRRKNLVTRKEAVLGVSEFVGTRDKSPERPHFDRAALLSAARERLGDSPNMKFEMLEREGGPRMERLIEGALAGAPLSRLSAALAHHDAPRARLAAPIAVHPFAEPFEHLRDASDRLFDECNVRPRVFLAAIGSVAEHLPRVNFARNLFEAGGFEVELARSGDDAALAARLRESGARIAVICGADGDYPQRVPPLARALLAAGARSVILAGNPGRSEEAFRAAGVDRFIFMRCDAVAILTQLLNEEGASL